MPATQYIVQVQCKLSKSAYWSPGARSAIFSTKSDSKIFTLTIKFRQMYICYLQRLQNIIL